MGKYRAKTYLNVTIEGPHLPPGIETMICSGLLLSPLCMAPDDWVEWWLWWWWWLPWWLPPLLITLTAFGTIVVALVDIFFKNIYFLKQRKKDNKKTKWMSYVYADWREWWWNGASDDWKRKCVSDWSVF